MPGFAARVERDFNFDWRFHLEKSPEPAQEIEFDGVYNNAEVWINGHSLGVCPYGYVPFGYDLTPWLRFGGATNVLAVRVDRTAHIDCRWYSGSGIYRDVLLVSTDRVHVPKWGLVITTPVVETDEAEVQAEIPVRNDSTNQVELAIQTDVFDANHQRVASGEAGLTRLPGTSGAITNRLKIAKPQLWSPETPRIFVWTGICYLGESSRWPIRGSDSRFVDFAGFPTHSYYLFQGLWRKEPVAHLATCALSASPYQTNAAGQIIHAPGRERGDKWGWIALNSPWNYTSGESVYIEAYANTETLELFLSDHSFGKQRLDDQADRLFKWVIPFAPGELRVVGENAEREQIHHLQTQWRCGKFWRGQRFGRHQRPAEIRYLPDRQRSLPAGCPRWRNFR